MGNCGPKNMKKLQAKYGDNLVRWVQAEAGKEMVRSQFQNTRHDLENHFNKKGYD